MADEDRFGLQRFVTAQAPVFATVTRELAEGAKRSHWMWFVFPQIAGLGTSPMARRYAISGEGEARAYLEHLVLGRRLLECTRLVNAVPGRGAEEIFGRPDDLKFRSSMTLFHLVDPAVPEFREALNRFFQGQGDPLTMRGLTVF